MCLILYKIKPRKSQEFNFDSLESHKNYRILDINVTVSRDIFTSPKIKKNYLK